MTVRLLFVAVFLACLLVALAGWIADAVRWAPRRLLAPA